MTRYESYCRRGWLARKFLASVSLHKPSWIAFPLPGVTPWPPTTKALAYTSDDNEDRKATRDSVAAHFPRYQPRYTFTVYVSRHFLLAFLPLCSFLSAFFHFFWHIASQKWEHSILIVNPPRWSSILRWILVSFFFFFLIILMNWKYMQMNFKWYYYFDYFFT